MSCFSFLQAIGVPTGSHGAFRDYQVDAVTLELSPRFPLNNDNSRYAFLLRSGRLVSVGIFINHLHMSLWAFDALGLLCDSRLFLFGPLWLSKLFCAFTASS